MGVLFVFNDPQKPSKTLGVLKFHNFGVSKLCNCCQNQESKCKNEQQSYGFGTSGGPGTHSHNNNNNKNSLGRPLGILGFSGVSFWCLGACLGGFWGLPRGVLKPQRRLSSEKDGYLAYLILSYLVL